MHIWVIQGGDISSPLRSLGFTLLIYLILLQLLGKQFDISENNTKTHLGIHSLQSIQAPPSTPFPSWQYSFGANCNWNLPFLYLFGGYCLVAECLLPILIDKINVIIQQISGIFQESCYTVPNIVIMLGISFFSLTKMERTK